MLNQSLFDKKTVPPPSVWLAAWNECHTDPQSLSGCVKTLRSGLRGHFGVWDRIRLKLDWTGWDKWTLATSGAVNTCLSFPRFKDAQFTSAAPVSALWARLLTNQFHLDGGQNRQNMFDFYGKFEIAEWLVWTCFYIINNQAINIRLFH